MKTNILKALLNLVKIKNFQLNSLYAGRNRMNNMGTALEYFVKDIFCDTINANGISEKDRKHSKFLSYSGNQNNPPDFIIKGGDAVEVKKIENKIKGHIALNSSYPKSKLHSNDLRILPSCKNCDSGNWKRKDMIYTA